MKRQAVFACDIGGSKLMCGLVTRDGQIIDKMKTPLAPDITIDALEQQDFAATIADLEVLDDTYHAALPSFDELMYLYGDPHNTRLFSRRDITQTLQRRCIRDRQLNLYDIHDERQSFIRRH